MNNLEFYKNSKKDKKISIYDKNNDFGFLVIPKTKENENDLTIKNTKLINLITTYSTLKDLAIEKEVKQEPKIKIIDEIIDIIDNTKHINYSPFCVYFQTQGTSYNQFKKGKKTIDEKREILKNILENYIHDRHNIYLSHGYSNQSMQVISDSNSSKRKGKTGIKIIEKFLSSFCDESSDINNFDKNHETYLFPEKKQKLFNEILEKNKIKFLFREEYINKYPDLLVKIGTKIIIIEHKLTSGSGGSQNSEIKEIIDFIKFNEENKNVHYVSCLDGDYFYILDDLNKKENKYYIQNRAVINNLSKNKNNYFLNINLLKELFIKFRKEEFKESLSYKEIN
ncbi:hypothetical protein [Mycoplasma sp. CSL10166]|uniref:hypothetical protein n=1 Tax=Mycoplasma sp. CSL10166 TaxID=2813825 RepID=UPI00197BC237|nr:hypothetical protein [Mycoplasma sp. CSL10166]MBN4084428.1 hypothetical protein [Mycoplasma sp. CSL10166]